MNWFNDLFLLLFPKLCGSCAYPLEKNEDVICIRCLADLPYTNYHLYTDNPVSQVFWGRINIEAATALLYFHKKGRTQQLLHNLKYKQRKDVGILLGKLIGNQIKDHEVFSKIDLIVPIPLHHKRLRQRGYNQAECFAEGISEILKKPICNDVVKRIKETSTQTNKTREERWNNISEAFEVNIREEFFGKHFLLVDDVLTTGATLEACAQTLLTLPQAKVSIAVIAKA